MTYMTMKARPWLAGAALVAGCLALISFGSRLGTESRAPDELMVASGQASLLTEALTLYQREYGRSPAGDQASVIKALTRGNPRQIEFIEPPPKALNKKGEFIDPWGTPYKIIPMPTPDDPLRLGVYSFGKNKKNEQGAKETDDIAS